MTLKGARLVLLRSLARRSLHRMQAQALLKDKGFEQAIIDEAIASLATYFDDQEWIDVRCSRWAREGKSIQQVKVKLHQRGIPANIGEYDEKKALFDLIQKKYSLLLDSGVPREKKQKAIQSLLRRGFSFSLVDTLLKENMVSLHLAEEEG